MTFGYPAAPQYCRSSGRCCRDRSVADRRPWRRWIRRQARAVDQMSRRSGRPRFRWSAMPALPQQALLYRLCGDRNPPHSRYPNCRRRFPGLFCAACAPMWMTCKAIVDALLDSDDGRGRLRRTLCWRGVPGRGATVNVWKDGRRLVAASSHPLVTTLWCSAERSWCRHSGAVGAKGLVRLVISQKST